MKKKVAVSVESLEPEKVNAVNPNILSLSPLESSSNMNNFT